MQAYFSILLLLQSLFIWCYFSNNLITHEVLSVMSENYKDIVLSPRYVYKGEILRALYLPNNCYWIFKRDNNEYKELLQIGITGKTTSLERINKYYNYVGDIKDDNEFLDIKWLVNSNVQLLHHKLNIEEEEAKEVLEDIFTSLNNTMECDIDYSNDELTQDQLEFTTSHLVKELGEPEQIIWDKIQGYNQALLDTNLSDLRINIISNLKNCKAQKKTQQMLAQYLSSKYGIILRKNTGDIYKLDNKGYTHITHDDIVLLLKDDFGANIVHDDDIKKAIGYLSERLEPTYNIVKFSNCLFNMGNPKFNNGELGEVTPDEPVFTLIESKYQYNPYAKSTILKKFLYTSFEIEGETPEESQKLTNEKIQGVLEVIGYFFTSGNKYQLFPICVGKGGGGKSVFTNLLTQIFGTDNIANLSLQEMENNTHGTSSLLNTHLNFIRDSDDTPIEKDSFIKNLTGNEEIPINPKHKDPFVLPKEEVPKTMMICNNMPPFKQYGTSLLRRILIIQFPHAFVGTDKQDPELEDKILANPEEIEWLIYNSIKAYEDKETKGEQFILKQDDSETMKQIEQNTNPINYILRELILKHDPEAYTTDKSINPKFKPIITNELAKVILYYGSEKGVNIPIDKNGQVSKRKLIGAIKSEFDLWEGELIPDPYSQDKEAKKIRDYRTQPEKVNGVSVRVYPNLIANPIYFKKLQELEEQEQ